MERVVEGAGTRTRSSGWWQRNWAELLTASGALVLFAWALDRNGWANTYYSAAVRSMTASWHNFFYGSLDPGGWITVDKPPGALWLQALSARVFGMNSWSLLLPSAVCGALAVWFLMLTVRRAWGRTAGVVAGVVLALTPVIVAVSRSNNPDGTLVLTVVLAAYFVQRGVGDVRVRWIVFAGVCCGFGFLTKLLASGLVMPGLWLAYLLAAPGAWRTRVLHCLAGAAAFFVVAFGWVLLVDVRALIDRPWIGGSTDGTALDLVFGYNGFGRITGAGAGPGGNGGFGGVGLSQVSRVFGGSTGIDQFGGSTGILRLFNAGMGDQVMWLLPIALCAAGVGVIAAGRRKLGGPRLGSIVMWTGWAIVVYVLFAFAKGIYHNYYVSLLAPALAALVGIGVAQLKEASVRGRVVAAVAVGATAVLQLVFLNRVDAWEWLRIAVPVGAVLVVVVAAVLFWRHPESRRAVFGVLAAIAVVLLAAPAAWSLAGVQHAQSGTFPDARPSVAGAAAAGPGGGGFGGAFGGGAGGGAGGAGAGGAGAGGAGGGAFGGGVSTAELKWLQSQRAGEDWILGVSSSMQGATAIIDGYDLVALGGFSGSDNSATPARVSKLVDEGRLRFLSVGGGFGGFGGGAGSGLSTAVSQACTAVDAAKWGGTGTSGVYDCRGKGAAMRGAAASAPATQPGGAQPGGAPTGGAPTQAPAGVDISAITKCFARHDVTVAPGKTPDLSNPKVMKALQACAALLPGRGAGGGPPSP